MKFKTLFKIGTALALIYALVWYLVANYTAAQIGLLFLIAAVGMLVAAMVAWAIDVIHGAIVDSGLFKGD